MPSSAAFQTHSWMAQDPLLMATPIFGCLYITSLGVRTMCDGTEHSLALRAGTGSCE